ncbi:hypothetical protein GYMLUDRAFT_174990, partial [Collybiopsis luxurians FD-317 M1]
YIAYLESYVLTGKKIWEFAKEHPDVDFTILLPSAIYGPLVPNYLTSDPDMQKSIGTNASLCRIFTQGTGEYPPQVLGHFVDVRDLAQAHIAALSSSLIPGRKKRILISNTTFKLKDVAELICRET